MVAVVTHSTTVCSSYLNEGKCEHTVAKMHEKWEGSLLQGMLKRLVPYVDVHLKDNLNKTVQNKLKQNKQPCKLYSF